MSMMASEEADRDAAACLAAEALLEQADAVAARANNTLPSGAAFTSRGSSRRASRRDGGAECHLSSRLAACCGGYVGTVSTARRDQDLRARLEEVVTSHAESIMDTRDLIEELQVKLEAQHQEAWDSHWATYSADSEEFSRLCGQVALQRSQLEKDIRGLESKMEIKFKSVADGFAQTGVELQITASKLRSELLETMTRNEEARKLAEAALKQEMAALDKKVRSLEEMVTSSPPLLQKASPLEVLQGKPLREASDEDSTASTGKFDDSLEARLAEIGATLNDKLEEFRQSQRAFDLETSKTCTRALEDLAETQRQNHVEATSALGALSQTQSRHAADLEQFVTELHDMRAESRWRLDSTASLKEELDGAESKLGLRVEEVSRRLSDDLRKLRKDSVLCRELASADFCEEIQKALLPGKLMGQLTQEPAEVERLRAVVGVDAIWGSFAELSSQFERQKRCLAEVSERVAAHLGPRSK
eukprot:TRINITY_DN40496_c0_g1_i1.p1 TRINITY_DN40496_c0_g1~~TRINITY_DN40496_c0_g1_i1.p1  ORF type:complete len:476 (+),score=132.18 TRINITY_DN40496_c0_g1_i1:174-1601(+)